jgi:hypothetical protein
MAAYNVKTKILIVDSQDVTVDTSAGAAKTISDYIETLDSTTNAIVAVSVTQISNTKTRVQIIHLG